MCDFKVFLHIYKIISTYTRGLISIIDKHQLCYQLTTKSGIYNPHINNLSSTSQVMGDLKLIEKSFFCIICLVFLHELNLALKNQLYALHLWKDLHDDHQASRECSERCILTLVVFFRLMKAPSTMVSSLVLMFLGTCQ